MMRPSSEGNVVKFLNILSLIALISACVPIKKVGSTPASPVELCGEKISLDSYRANESDFAGMKEELKGLGIVKAKNMEYYDKAVEWLKKNEPRYEVTDLDLTLEEKIAIQIWTKGLNPAKSAPYLEMNRALRSPNPSIDHRVDSTVRTLASAINKLKGVPCTGIRAVSREMPASFMSLSKGSIFKDKGFIAFTAGHEPAAAFSMGAYPISMKVTSKGCKDISGFSSALQEKEFLFPPGSEFEILEKSSFTDDFGTLVDHFEIKHIPKL